MSYANRLSTNPFEHQADGCRRAVYLKAACTFFLACFVCAGIRSAQSQAGIFLAPGANIQAAVDANPPDTRFVLGPGIYRMQSIVPKRGDAFVAESSGTAVLDGAALISSFTQTGQLWTAMVRVQPPTREIGKCMVQHQLCKEPQDLYLDGQALTPVNSRASVTGGEWYLDVNAARIYLGSNPQGHTVEIGETEQAFVGPADSVMISGLTVEHYASGAQNPAISALAPNNGRSSHYWTIENCEVRWNHGTGIGGGHFSRIFHNHVHHNGQLGISAGGNSAVVRENEIDHNNTAGYDPGWEAGGAKFVRSFNLTVDSNSVHDNRGPGLWTDGYNMKTTYENNRTYGNWIAGILHEISYDAVIRNNTVKNDGFNISNHTSPWYGGGIVISSSSNTEVYGNTVIDCMNGIIILQTERPPGAKNVYVHNNVIKQRTGVAAGVLFSSSGNLAEYNDRFKDNTYELGDNAGGSFECFNKACSLAKWKELGNN